MQYRQFNKLEIWMEQILQKLDSLERILESRQKDDEIYRKGKRK